MRIAFDVSPLSHERTGVNNYLLGSLQGLAEVAVPLGHELVAFAPTSLRGRHTIAGLLAGLPVELRLVPLPASHVVRTAWSATSRPAVERWLGRVDVLHFSDWMYPPQRSGVRATTVHDVVPVRHPEWTTPRTRAMHVRKYRNAAETCDVVFANSAFTARDFSDAFDFPLDRVRVAPPGVASIFWADGEAADLGRPYILTVATLEPRKNLDALLDAFALLEEAGLLLAVAGGVGWGTQPRLDRRDVVRLGRVSDVELARLYRGAAVVVYPSLYEGFGMPVVEAMASGAPVVASEHASLDEAAGDAAVRADSRDPAAIAAAVLDAIARRDDLRARGLAHAASFTWRRTGATFLEGYEACV
ncbi:MAG TPA: glycosyltransferase family 1 protein [Acidimicrobiales bacterium]|nr:glycosyltransferase family 1 protein [Acidimicrobiales bacterium]